MSEQEIYRTSETDSSIPDNSEIVTYDDVLLAARELPHGAPDTFGATPLDKTIATDQQSKLLRDLQGLTLRATPEGTPRVIKRYILDTFGERFNSRGEANWENYKTSLKSEELYADEPIVMESIERAKPGHASPAELALVRQLLAMRSIELAARTISYGMGIKAGFLKDMQTAVQINLEFLGAKYFKEPEEVFRVKELIPDEDGTPSFEHGLLFTRKRILCALNDGTIVKERTSFVLRIDKESLLYGSGVITDEQIARMAAVDPDSPDWGDQIADISNIADITKDLLEHDVFTEVIPLSATIYAFHPETAKLVKEKVAYDAAMNTDQRYANHPEIAHLMRLQRAGGLAAVLAYDPTQAVLFKKRNDENDLN
jgi:hypothetical protein